MGNDSKKVYTGIEQEVLNMIEYLISYYMDIYILYIYIYINVSFLI